MLLGFCIWYVLLFLWIMFEVISANRNIEHCWSSKGMQLLKPERTNGWFVAYIVQHVHKACQIGADLICAQGGEAGGHTGEIPTRYGAFFHISTTTLSLTSLFSILIPACADICKTYKSSFTGQPVQLIAAGGIFDGRSIASTFMLGANAVWVGTRFVTARESLVPDSTKRE